MGKCNVTFEKKLHSLTAKQTIDQRFPTFFSVLPTFDVTDPQLPTTIYQKKGLNVSICPVFH